MSDFLSAYHLWAEDSYFDDKTREELIGIRDDINEIEERFYRDLEFGTGGLRGIIGAGTNRINVYTIRKVTAGVADYINSIGSEAAERGVAVSYDSRHFSKEFATAAACLLAHKGIKVYLSDELRPVPLLSYAVRYFNAYAGIMITASHNPPKYNGYKLYGEDGGQVPPEAATQILNYRNAIDDIRSIVEMPFEQALADGKIEMFGKAFDDAYTEMLCELIIDREAIEKQSEMSIVYTPLHGSGYRPVKRILSEVGFRNIHIVESQSQPDGRFPTVKTPNPEDPAALQMGINLAREVGAGLVIGTDPDCDRVGVAVLDKTGDGTYRSLSGNQIGLLLMDYILGYKKDNGTLPPKSFVVTTIVSSRLAGKICEYYGVELQEVLTGFKFIGERIKIFDEEGDMHFQFGFEESYGFLSGLNVRDKDAVVASMLIAGMAAQSLEKGQTLLDRLDNLYERFGYGFEDAVSFTLEGKAGVEKIAATMSSLRLQAEAAIAGSKDTLIPGVSVHAIRDYKTSTRYILGNQTKTVESINLPSSDVILYELGGQKGIDWACVRPSGTEPKLKVYFGAYATDKKDTENVLNTQISVIRAHVEAMLSR
ncbi:MAG: phospho-sugar mutase [Clostridiaceae bacterium]|mgnify:CR=1 FL=1|nr:phospho-sugar mutase [Clostridiaceae bacterium]